MMDDLCTACLCTGRNLFFIGETGHYHLYSQILNEIPVYDFSDVCVRVCWECRAMLQRFGKFKTLVKRSYTELLQQLHKNIPPNKQSLIRPPHLGIDYVFDISYPEKPVKVESKDEDHEHIESTGRDRIPEGPFSVDDIKVDVFNNDDDVKVEDVNIFEYDQNVRETKKSQQVLKEISKKLKSKVKVKKKKVPQKTKKKKREVKTQEDASCVLLNDDGIGEKDCLSTTPHADSDVFDDVLIANHIEESHATKNNIKDCIVQEKEVIKMNKIKEKPNGRIIEDKLPEPVGDKPKCQECGKMFSSKKTYRYHLNTLHKGQNRYPCPRCDKIYQWKSNLGRHLRTHRALDSGELHCAPCDKRFASVATYRQHLRISRRHVTEIDYSFECGECGKRFVNKTRLRDHVDWEHLHKVKFRCQMCDKPFKCHTSLYVHMQNVHRNKKKDNLCHICGKSYQNAAKLKYHIVAMHTSETPYSCGECGAAFGWYSSLYRHTREVHHKMKLQPKKPRKQKRADIDIATTRYDVAPTIGTRVM